MTDRIDPNKGWIAAMNQDIARTTMPPEIENLPDPRNLKMGQDTEGMSPIMVLANMRKKIIGWDKINLLDDSQKELFAARMMRSIGAQTADGVAPELQQQWTFLVTSTDDTLANKTWKVDVHSALNLKAGRINGKKVELGDEDFTVMRVSGACCYFVIMKNLALARAGRDTKFMKTIVRDNFGRLTDAQRSCLVIGISMWARNSSCQIPGTTKQDQYVATFVVALTSGLLEPLTALSKLIKRGLLTHDMIDSAYPEEYPFPTIRAGSDAYAICKGFIMECKCSDLKDKFAEQEQKWIDTGALEEFAKLQLED